MVTAKCHSHCFKGFLVCVQNQDASARVVNNRRVRHANKGKVRRMMSKTAAVVAIKHAVFVRIIVK